MRDIDSLKGLHILRTMHSTKKRSIPRIHSSAYLELYMLNKEKERLLKEDKRLCIRKDIIKKRLEEINMERNKLQAAEATVKTGTNSNSSEQAYTQGNGVKKEWKTIPLKY